LLHKERSINWGWWVTIAMGIAALGTIIVAGAGLAY